MPAVAEKKKKSGDRKIAKNSKAFHDYFVEDSYEAGIELAGTEVKSIRMGNVNLKDAFCTDQGRADVRSTECTSSPYEKGNIFNKRPAAAPAGCSCTSGRSSGSSAKVKQDGYALVPARACISKAPRVKVEVGAVQGQKAL